MRPKHYLKNPLIMGTMLLTASGVISRIIGFFYRIFLSQTIGADGIGIYTLATPVLALSFAVCSAGIQTSISRFIAQQHALSDSQKGNEYLSSGLLLSLGLSLCCFLVLFLFPDFIALRLLQEKRCIPLIRVLAFSIPCASVHACVNGYFYGLKKSVFPAISQLLEQLARVLSVYILWKIAISRGQSLTPLVSAVGIVAGEASSMLLSLSVIGFSHFQIHQFSLLTDILSMALPLSANRVILTLFQSAETVLIPTQLLFFGYTNTEALSVFGVLTGMALPTILFPSVLVNSISVLLLPEISEAQATQNLSKIRQTIRKTSLSCLLLGFLCTLGFLLTGSALGRILFDNALAGTFILCLSWLCPFLYLTTTLSSILHGLGKTNLTFLLNLSGCGIRILSILLFIPIYGLKAYLWGTLASYILMSGLAWFLCLHLTRQK